MIRKFFRKQIAGVDVTGKHTTLFSLNFLAYFKCREDNRCQSFNWVISLLTCEFKNKTKEAMPDTPNPDRSYYQRDLERGEPA